jgi:histidinol-phosphate phosphatase family protein
MSDPLECAVILCGGQGTRLAPAIGDLPKVLAPVADRPLLAHLLSKLARAGARRVVLLAGSGGEAVSEIAPTLAPPGLVVETIVERNPLGTGGALRSIESQLPERFLVLFGDIYATVDFRRLSDSALERGGLGTLLVHRSSHPEDSDVVAIDDAQRLISWMGRGPRRTSSAVGAAALTNAAVSVLHRDLLRRIPSDRPSDLTAEVLPPLVDARAPLYAYVSSEYVRDIGTPERLRSVDADCRAGRTALAAELALLDRDGVLVEEGPEPVVSPDGIRLLPGAAEGVRCLNEAGIRVVVVTNQAVVARGLCSPSTLEAIHGRLRDLLAAQGAKLDAIYHCPHHPETHWQEGPSALRGPCRCRKPSTGMVERALDETGVVAWRGVVVGDATIDLQLAANAGLAGICVRTGKGGDDGLYPARATWQFDDLRSAARWLTGSAQGESPTAW